MGCVPAGETVRVLLGQVHRGGGELSVKTVLRKGCWLLSSSVREVLQEGLVADAPVPSLSAALRVFVLPHVALVTRGSCESVEAHGAVATAVEEAGACSLPLASTFAKEVKGSSAEGEVMKASSINFGMVGQDRRHPIDAAAAVGIGVGVGEPVPINESRKGM